MTLAYWWTVRRASNEIIELEKSLESLGKVLRHRADLVNEIAHEIKNPITAMLCSVETLNLILSNSLDDTNKRTLAYMKEYGDHILRLVSDFIDVSRVEGGTLTSTPIEISVISTIESVVGLLHSNAIAKNIKIHVLKTDQEIYAFVDDKHLKQIVFNLVHNAIKFTPKNGEIEIRTKQDVDSNQVKVAVKDSGAGIPEEFHKSIFDLYSRYDGNQPKTNVGMGLGLALCKSLVELAGGKLEVFSEVDCGSTFEFTIPLVQKTIVKPEEQQKSPNKPLIGQSFLLVDKDEASRHSMASLIEAWGGLVDQVSSAVEAVNAVTGYNYDAVLIDKTDDGFDAKLIAENIQDQIKDNSTTLILAGAEESHLLEDEKIKNLAKPFNGEKLLKTLLRSGKFEISH
ncbi:MAG: hybrid sensor histidine kinase/response regulator [Bdellovibrionota bacterium]